MTAASDIFGRGLLGMIGSNSRCTGAQAVREAQESAANTTNGQSGEKNLLFMTHCRETPKWGGHRT